MSKLLLIYSTLLIGLVFMIIPNWYMPYDFFLFSDMKISGANFIYFIGERSVLVILSYIIAVEATKYRDCLWTFFWLMVADLIDFILDYNNIWFHIGQFPVSMNTIKSIIFGLTILNAWIRTQFK